MEQIPAPMRESLGNLDARQLNVIGGAEHDLFVHNSV